MRLTTFTLDDKIGRLRYLRHLTGLTRLQVTQKYGIPEITLKSWESRKLPLTRNGLERCIEAYSKESVYTTVKWVEEGIGPIPSLDLGVENKHFLDRDIELFKSVYHELMVHQVEQDNMYPRYKRDEIVMGVIHRGKLSSVDEKDCIVELENNERVVARVCIRDDKIFLVSINNDFIKDGKSLITEAAIKFIAPIKWHKIT